MDNKIYIACATDENYMEKTVVMLYSLMIHTMSKIEVHILCTNKKIIKKIAKIEDKFCNIKIFFYNVDENIFKNYKTSERINKVSYYRLLLGDVLPKHIDKIIYLDSDLIVRSDITKLWNVSIGGKIIGAVPDVGAQTRYVSSSKAITLYQQMKIPKKCLYFNAGVLLIDIVQWNKLNCREKIEKYCIENKKYINFHDQDALNAILWNSWYRLDYTWNVISDLFYDVKFCKEELGSNKYNKLINEAKVVHFTGRVKPWHRKCEHMYKEEYLQYMKESLKIFEFSEDKAEEHLNGE